MALDQILHYRAVEARLATSGQPSQAQIAEIGAAGFEVVINLALSDDPRYSLPDEPARVAAAGMSYVHIPVPFSAPSRGQWLQFAAAMDRHRGQALWLHCAANYRVTAFLGLYRVLRLGWPRDQAFALMLEVWQPDAVWARFIEHLLDSPALPDSPAAAPAEAASEASMADYYARRAAYYERVYHKPERQADLRAMAAWLAPRFEGRRVLELACGTGWWTPIGAAQAASWLATDLSPETMAIARTKPLPPGIVEFRTVDAYTLAELGEARSDAAGSHGAPSFDAAFAGCWWSHVPLARLPKWLETLHARLEPGALVVMLDNRFVAGSSTPISRRDAEGNSYQLRTLDDGTHHEVLKNFPEPEQAFAMLGPRARDPQWTAFDHYWILGYTLD
jgi:protein tyrosine phosphatase (PTP) superfamily phosphohydrolase (DUF442 family)/SAM-dependent methyltransferase